MRGMQLSEGIALTVFTVLLVAAIMFQSKVLLYLMIVAAVVSMALSIRRWVLIIRDDKNKSRPLYRDK